MIPHREDCLCRICQALDRAKANGWVEQWEDGSWNLTPKGEAKARQELERGGK